MKKFNLWTGFGFMFFCIISCTSPPEVPAIDMDSVRAEITALEAAYTGATNAKDAEALLAYYADDAQSLPPNKPTLVGKDAIRADYLKEMEGDSTQTTSLMTVNNVWASGDMAVETGTFSVTNEAGEEVAKGKYMSLFEKRDGKYVCIRDIWNSDMPKKEAEKEADSGEESSETEDGD